ncbi:MAG TPA: GlsB/YeaQ/YmgE family stress response membrane protein [Spongiibacteraceae bacterium]|nr:GlsB/YeaQ/YmgE family stress response membrane protein [Spongiibacteraceae bacterium]
MDLTALLVFLIIGAIAGWLAGKIIKGGGFGLVGNMVVGILGAVVGGYLFRLVGIYNDGGLIGSIITATLGAVVLLYVIKLVKKV